MPLILTPHTAHLLMHFTADTLLTYAHVTRQGGAVPVNESFRWVLRWIEVALSVCVHIHAAPH